MILEPSLDASADVPLYRQLSGYLEEKIRAGALRPGDRLPPTRDLAGQLGLNRTTVSAAYDLLHAFGLIESRGARGSFVSPASTAPGIGALRANTLTPSLSRNTLPPASGVIDFTTSRPSSKLFPLDQFREACNKVLASPELPRLMQLGSPRGYEPLRQFLLRKAIQDGVAHPDDDVLITSGCQQAVDLVRRAFIRPGDRVLIEDPVYPGLRNSLEEAGADLTGVPVGEDGIDLDVLAVSLPNAKLLVVTPSFQNPTGATIPAANRAALLRMARTHGVVVVENGIYAGLRYAGEPIEPLKHSGEEVVLMGSFSKMAFPGLRVGWILAPRPVIDRVAELKQLTDLHTDQLSQAFLLEFARSGMLEEHCTRAVSTGAEKLQAVKATAERFLDGCSWRLPEGGMNLWVELPAGLDASTLRIAARQAGIDFLPGAYFAVGNSQDRSSAHGHLRLSFVGLEPEEIRRGMEILGQLIASLTERRGRGYNLPVPALV